MHLLDESLEYIVYNLPEKLMEIYFFSIALPNTGRYFIRYSYFISRATICAKISKILKISNFSQLHLISKLIPQSSLIYFPPTVSHKSSRYISRATSPVLSFFFFFFFISKSTTAIHQRDLRLAHICSRIFLLQTRVIFQN